jgi:hypothetical protein
MNNLTPAMTDIEDLRLGRFMSKFDYYINDWALSTIILHENRYSLLPRFGSDFAPQNQTIADNMIIDEPNNSLKNSGLAISLSKNFEGQDVAFYASNQFVDNTKYRTNMIGVAYNRAMNNFLIKSEIAYFDNYDSTILDDKIDSLIGLEYNGIDEGSISLEVANKDETIQYALRFTQSYINQTIDLSALVNMYGKDTKDGGFMRVWSDYAYNDDLSLSVGLVSYISGDNPKFEMMKDNDKVFGSVKYSF